MSDTETGIIPRPHTLEKNRDGLIRWRPEYDSLRVERLPFDGRRLVATTGGSRAEFDMTAEQAAHLAMLLGGARDHQEESPSAV